MLQSILFYLFSAVLLSSAVMVIAARNPVHAVLFLILAFFNAAGLFLMMGAEFVAFILVIVYVGAVAVLFLFVVMMLDVNFDQLREGFQRYAPFGAAIGAVLFLEVVVTVAGWQFVPNATFHLASATPPGVTNTSAIGQVLYTDYFYPFQVSGLVLLVAMMGAIILTLRDRKDALRQNAAQQLNRPISEIIETRKVVSGQGVEI